MTITQNMRNYVASKLRNHADVEDVCQEAEIAAWRAGATDVALVWRIVNCRLSNFRRAAGRRACEIADSEIIDLSPAADSGDQPDVEHLLSLAGPYRDDVQHQIDGGGSTRRSRRGIARIKAALAE